MKVQNISIRMTWIEQGSAEWERVWQALEDKFGCRDCMDDHTGERWQYMGTTDRHHEFRHRNYNGLGRKVIRINKSTLEIE